MKKLSAKFLCVVLSLVVLLCALPVTVYAEGTTVIDVESAEELTAACATINENGGTYTINLTGDIIGGQVEIKNKDAVVTVIGNGKTISATQSAVYVSDGAKVILGDGISELTLTSADNNDTPGIVHVLKDSSCTMNNQVTLKDHDGQNYLGGGVTVEGGTFVMDGGTITDCSIAGTEVDDNGGSVCYGGGVAVFNSGSFTMNGGTITKCNVTTDYSNSGDYNQISGIGGGVFVTSGSVFNMNGGTISNCTASLYGGGVAVVSANQNGNFKSIVNINSGTISDNTAAGGAGVFASGFLYAKADPIATNAELAGSTNTGSSGSTDALHGEAPSTPGLYIGKSSSTDSILIENNHANGTYVKNAKREYANGLGGGVLIANIGTNTSHIYDAEISANTADIGAGVAVFHHKTQTHIDNCTITGNTAVRNGGGFAAIRNKDDGESTFGYSTIKNTTITGNKSGDRGAGVYYDEESKLYISGADNIQSNTFNGVLNNLNVLSVEKPVYVNGALTGSKIGLSDPRLWDDELSDIEAPDDGAAELLTNGYKANNPEVHPSEYFTSDHETWIVERTAKTTTTKPDPNSKMYREYKVKRYAAVLPNTVAYAGCRYQYVITDVQNPALTDISTNDDIISELKYRFESSNNYTVKDQSNPNYGSTYITYTPKASDSTASSIRLQKAPNKNEVTLTYNGKQPRSNYVTFTASPNIQSRYANSGKLVLQITSNGDTYLNQYTFSTDYTEETVDYVNLNPPGNVLYEYDEYGDVAAKLEIVSYESKQAQIEVETGTDEEVRLVRIDKPNYHINNTDIANTAYSGEDIFTPYVEAATKEIKVGETIEEFYLIPEVKASKQDSCPYIFKGWYYDPENDNDTHPVKFDTDKYAKDIYAHWIKVEGVEKADADEKELPQGYTQYGGFDLAGIQISEGIRDTNFSGHKKPGGLRFITSLSMDVVNKIKALQPGNNIEYGYVAATNTDWITYHKGVGNKLQYVSETANGIITSGTEAKEKDYFDFASNINCTSKQCSSSGVVKDDHRNYKDYLLYTLVITYEGAGDAMRGTMVLARPYIHYTDANGLERVAYSEYRGNSNTIGGCYISYNDMH